MHCSLVDRTENVFFLSWLRKSLMYSVKDLGSPIWRINCDLGFFVYSVWPRFRVAVPFNCLLAAAVFITLPSTYDPSLQFDFWAYSHSMHSSVSRLMRHIICNRCVCVGKFEEVAISLSLLPYLLLVFFHLQTSLSLCMSDFLLLSLNKFRK